MTTSALSRRARFRSQATLESFRDATIQLRRASPGHPVISAPTNDGVPGLRMRALDQGVEFYRLGKPGSVVFNGISSEQVMDAHNDCMDGDHRCTVLESPGAMTSTELREDDYRGAGDGLKVISSVVRRLGLLARLGSRSIDTWIGNPDHICVEAFINPLDNEAYFALIADLLSPMLSPTWELVALGDDAPYSPPRPQFQIPGLHHHLDLRLRFRMS